MKYHYFISYFVNNKTDSGFGNTEMCFPNEICSIQDITHIQEQIVNEFKDNGLIEENNNRTRVIIINYVLIKSEEAEDNSGVTIN